MHESENSSVLEPDGREEPGSPESAEISDLGYVLLWSWLHPRRAAERAANWSLTKCFLFHFGVGLLGAMLISSALVMLDSSSTGVQREIDDFVRGLDESTVEFVLTCLGIIALVEGIHLALAWVLSAWGSVADERLRDSLRSALRQTWLRTPHAVLVAFLIAMGINTVDIRVKAWRESNPDVFSTVWPTPPNYPNLPATDPNYSTAMEKFGAEQREYIEKSAKATETYQERWRSQPWYVRFEDQSCIALVVAGIAWWLSGLLAAVSFRRVVTATEKSPLCLWCGYDLSMQAMDNRCPECGESVENSLGNAAQPGVPWERRRELGRLRTWWATSRQAVGRPREFGRCLRLLEHRDDHRMYILPSLAIIYLIGLFGIFALIFSTGLNSGFIDEIPLVAWVGFIFGAFCVMGATLVSCGVASLVGWVASLRSGRNLLPASTQMAAYCFPYLAAWALLGGVLINCITLLESQDMLDVLLEPTGLNQDFALFAGFLVFNAMCGSLYIAFVARGTSGARFANR